MEKTQQYEYAREILNYDGFILSVEYKDAYMLMNHSSIHNPEAIEVGKTVHFNVKDGLVSEARIKKD